MEENGGNGARVSGFPLLSRALALLFGANCFFLFPSFSPLKHNTFMFFDIDYALILHVCIKRTCKVQLAQVARSGLSCLVRAKSP